MLPGAPLILHMPWALQVPSDEPVTHYYLPLNRNQANAMIEFYTTDSSDLRCGPDLRCARWLTHTPAQAYACPAQLCGGG